MIKNREKKTCLIVTILLRFAIETKQNGFIISIWNIHRKHDFFKEVLRIWAPAIILQVALVQYAEGGEVTFNAWKIWAKATFVSLFAKAS